MTSMRSGGAAPAHMSNQQLEEAFAAFNRVSMELGTAWRDLEQQVAQLSEELAQARSARLQELAEKERLADKLSTLMAALPGAVVVVGADGRVEDCNPVAEAMLCAGLVGRRWAEVLGELTARPPAHSGEFDARDQRRFALEYSELSNTEARIALLTDITERHRLSQLMQREQRLRELGDMAARLAHQLRTPLSSAMLYVSQLARPGVAPERGAEISGRVQESLRQVERLIDGMLRFIRGEEESCESLHLNALLREHCEAIAPQLERAGLELELELPIEELRIDGQREKLGNAVANLLDNAMRSSPARGRIDVRLRRAGAGFEIAVADRGPGVPEALREKIFEPWFSTRDHGTGLGLAVVASAARAHGGNAFVTAAAGGGSEFCLRLPRHRKPEENG